MARTPDVVDGNVISAGWGNQIRDRTRQVFTTKDELFAWIAPDGALGWVSQDGVAYTRNAGMWKPSGCLQWGGPVNVTTFGDGNAAFPHAMDAMPSWALVQPRWPHAWRFHYVNEFNFNGVNCLCQDINGNPLGGVNVGAFLIVGTALDAGYD